MPPRNPLPVAILVASACFVDPPPLSTAGDESSATSDVGAGSSGESSSTADADSTTHGSGSMSSSSADTTAAETDTTTEATTEATSTTDDTSEVCGDLGQACCDRGCTRGLCHANTCVAFRGAYADPLPCDGCEAIDHLPTLPSCDCEDFVSAGPFALHTDTCNPDLSFVEAHLYMCQAELDADVTGSDWGGAHLRVLDSPCAEIEETCVVPNAYTGTCACPGGMDEIVTGVQGPAGGCNGPHELVLCSSHATAPITFAGAYQTLDPADEGDPPVCHVGNPRADFLCACPEGFAAQGLRIINTVNGFGGTLHFCVGTP